MSAVTTPRAGERAEREHGQPGRLDAVERLRHETQQEPGPRREAEPLGARGPPEERPLQGQDTRPGLRRDRLPVAGTVEPHERGQHPREKQGVRRRRAGGPADPPRLRPHVGRQDRVGQHRGGGAGQEDRAHLSEAHQRGQRQPGRGPRAGRVAKRLDQLAKGRGQEGDPAGRVRHRRAERDACQGQGRRLAGEAATGPADDPERQPVEQPGRGQGRAKRQHRHDEEPARCRESCETDAARGDAAEGPRGDRHQGQDSLRQHLESQDWHHGAERAEGSPAARTESRRRRRQPRHAQDQGRQATTQHAPEP